MRWPRSTALPGRSRSRCAAARNLEDALAGGAKHLLLDNLTPDEAREWIRYIDGRATTELLRPISILRTIRSYAEAGPDYISCGAHHPFRSLCRYQFPPRIRSPVKPLDIAAVRAARPQNQFHYFETIGSTMTEAAPGWLASKLPTTRLSFSDEQTSGVGRMGRSWISEKKRGRLHVRPAAASAGSRQAAVCESSHRSGSCRGNRRNYPAGVRSALA